MSNVLNYFEQPSLDNDNKFVVGGTMVVGDTDINAIKLANVLASNDFKLVSANAALLVSGFNVVAGGTGISGLTLAAPQEGARCDIVISAITSGSVVVTTASGTTFDGTNNTATFNAANDQLTLVYSSATEWQVVFNNSVVLSAV